MSIQVVEQHPPYSDSIVAEFEVTGEDIALLPEIDDWCDEHVGYSGCDWSRDALSSFATEQRGTYVLLTSNRDAVFAFRLRWCR